GYRVTTEMARRYLVTNWSVGSRNGADRISCTSAADFNPPSVGFSNHSSLGGCDGSPPNRLFGTAKRNGPPCWARARGLPPSVASPVAATRTDELPGCSRGISRGQTKKSYSGESFTFSK